jgi:hypothetical protein
MRAILTEDQIVCFAIHGQALVETCTNMSKCLHVVSSSSKFPLESRPPCNVYNPVGCTKWPMWRHQPPAVEPTSDIHKGFLKAQSKECHCSDAFTKILGSGLIELTNVEKRSSRGRGIHPTQFTHFSRIGNEQRRTERIGSSLHSISLYYRTEKIRITFDRY